MDRYTKVVLTIIAGALCVLAARGVPGVAPAHAADVLECRMSVQDFRDALEVKVQAPSFAPGSSATSPLYVRTVQ